VHDVAAHLTAYLRFGQAKLYLGILVTAADIDRISPHSAARWGARLQGLRLEATDTGWAHGTGPQAVTLDA
jgi:hypothetical protein